MAITLQNLLKFAPLTTEVRDQLLTKLNTLTPEQKYQISNSCWMSLAEQFRIRLKAKTEAILLEVREKKRQYNPNDLVEAETSLYYDFAKELDVVGSEEGVAQIREELKKFSTPK